MLTIFKWVGIPNELKYGLQGGGTVCKYHHTFINQQTFRQDIGYFKTVTLPDRMCF